MNPVKLLGLPVGQVHQFECTDAQPRGLDSSQDFPRQITANGIRLNDHKSTFFLHLEVAPTLDAAGCSFPAAPLCCAKLSARVVVRLRTERVTALRKSGCEP